MTSESFDFPSVIFIAITEGEKLLYLKTLILR